MLDQATALMDRPESTSFWGHAGFASFGAQHLAWRSPSSAVVDIEAPEPGQSDAEPGGRGLFDARMLAERHPESPTALARLAAAEFAAGHRVSAERAATKVLESDSFDAPALVVATHVLASLGEFADAERAVRKVHSSASNDEQRNAAAGIGARVSLNFRPPEEALGLLHDCDDPAGLTLRAWVLSKMGRPADAVRDLRASLKAQPDNPIAWHELSYAHTLLGSHTKALKASLTASHLAPADMTVVASLVALLVMKEQFTDAIRAIDRIASHRPDSLRLIRLQAAVQNQSGDTPGALRRLRRAMRTTAWTKAEPTEREELQLDARLSSLFLKQAAGAQERATKEAVAALKRCGYRSLDIACFVADTTSSVSDLEVLERAYAELNGPHEEVSPLLGIESTIEYLRFDFDASTEAAVERARLQPCSETAQMRASYMLSMSAGDYEQAARICHNGIRLGLRGPGLRNNAAFALAMAGDTEAAERILPDTDEAPLSLATAGLISIVNGNVRDGEAMYDECATYMRAHGMGDNANQVEMHKQLARAVAGLPILPSALEPFSELVKADARYALIHKALDRETSRAKQ